MTRTLDLHLVATIPGGTITVDAQALTLDGLDPVRRTRVLGGLEDLIHDLFELASIGDPPAAVEHPAVAEPPTPEDLALPATPLVETEGTPPPEPGRATPRPPTATSKGPGTVNGLRRQLLEAIADEGGTWEGSAPALGRHAGAATTEATVRMSIQKLKERGLISLVKANRTKTRSISLTGAGWAALDRTPPKHPAAGGAGGSYSERSTEHSTEPRATVTDIDAGPIERRPFDAERARAGAAAAL